MMFFVGAQMAVGAVELSQPVAEYGIGDWAPNGLGNHRAWVQVEEAARAVRVFLPWRRQDPTPADKGIVIYCNGKPQKLMTPFSISSESGEFAFAPEEGPGVYEIYYLPYTYDHHYFGDTGTYLSPTPCPDEAWRKYATGNRSLLPTAKLLRLEARSEYHSFHPMEVWRKSRSST